VGGDTNGLYFSGVKEVFFLRHFFVFLKKNYFLGDEKNEQIQKYNPFVGISSDHIVF
jgi:hypothetical protein